jgi:hypothetical protein
MDKIMYSIEKIEYDTHEEYVDGVNALYELGLEVVEVLEIVDFGGRVKKHKIVRVKKIN